MLQGLDRSAWLVYNKYIKSKEDTTMKRFLVVKTERNEMNELTETYITCRATYKAAWIAARDWNRMCATDKFKVVEA